MFTPTTSVFNSSYPICSASPSVSGTGTFVVTEIHGGAVGSNSTNLNDEYVAFENTGSGDLSGWTVEDEAAHTYTFPSGFTLDAEATVTLHSAVAPTRRLVSTGVVALRSGTTLVIRSTSSPKRSQYVSIVTCVRSGPISPHRRSSLVAQ